MFRTSVAALKPNSGANINILLMLYRSTCRTHTVLAAGFRRLVSPKSACGGPLRVSRAVLMAAVGFAVGKCFQLFVMSWSPHVHIFML